MTEKIEKHLPHLLGLPDQLVSSFVQSCPTLCDPKHCSMPGFLVHYQLPSPTCSNSYSSVQWCHPTISSSVVPFSSCLQFSPESGSFPISQFLTLGGQSIGASVSASLLPMNIQDWFPLRLTAWIACSRRDSQESSPTPHFKSTSSSALSFLYGSTLTSIHDYWINQEPCILGIKLPNQWVFKSFNPSPPMGIWVWTLVSTKWIHK